MQAETEVHQQGSESRSFGSKEDNSIEVTRNVTERMKKNVLRELLTEMATARQSLIAAIAHMSTQHAMMSGQTHEIVCQQMLLFLLFIFLLFFEIVFSQFFFCFFFLFFQYARILDIGDGQQWKHARRIYPESRGDGLARFLLPWRDPMVMATDASLSNGAICKVSRSRCAMTECLSICRASTYLVQ